MIYYVFIGNFIGKVSINMLLVSPFMSHVFIFLPMDVNYFLAILERFLCTHFSVTGSKSHRSMPSMLHEQGGSCLDPSG